MTSISRNAIIKTVKIKEKENMKTLLKIKKEMIDRGYSLRYVKIKRDKETNTFWVYTDNQEEFEEYAKALSEVAEIPVSSIMKGGQL